MANARVSRGRKTQHLFAEYMQKFGFFGAESFDGAKGGSDVIGVPGWDVEVKATSSEPILAAIRQQAKRLEKSNDLGFVAWRPNGYGPERIGDWVVAMPASQWMSIMRELEFPEMTHKHCCVDIPREVPREVEDALDMIQQYWNQRD